MVTTHAGGWCPPGGCPARLGEQLQHAVTLAFEQGRAYERAELAEMEATWKPLARETYEQRVTARIAAMEAAAARLAAELVEKHGRIPWAYTGGPVDWDTGRPLRESASQTSHESGSLYIGSGVAA